MNLQMEKQKTKEANITEVLKKLIWSPKYTCQLRKRYVLRKNVIQSQLSAQLYKVSCLLADSYSAKTYLVQLCLTSPR